MCELCEPTLSVLPQLDIEKLTQLVVLKGLYIQGTSRKKIYLKIAITK